MVTIFKVADSSFGHEHLFVCSGEKCDKSLKVKVNNEEIKILHDGKVEIESKELILPHHTYFYAMERVTTNFFKVSINNGITVLFDGVSRIYVRSKPSLSGRMRGMCGNFNQQTKDDWITPAGDTAANAVDFGDEW
ncbi:MAG: VWD domain-containing protein [Bacteroidota bacterium]